MPSLEDLPTEIQFAIFAALDHPGRLALGLTGPFFLHLLARFCRFDAWQDDANFKWYFGLPEGTSWDDTAALPVIVRALTCGYCAPKKRSQEAKELSWDDWKRDLASQVPLKTLNIPFQEPDEQPSREREQGSEEAQVEKVVNSWLKSKFGVTGGYTSCAGCGRFMRTNRDNWSFHRAGYKT